MEYNLISKVSSKLSKKQIKKICELKDTQWKFGIKSQFYWYKKNIRNNDIHNLFFINSKLIGYTLLRKRTCYMKNMKSIKYLLFDALIVDKRFRGKKLSNLIMDFNNNIIKQSGFFSFLICKKKLITFYKKFGWIKLKNKDIVVKGRSFSTTSSKSASTYVMTYNQKYMSEIKYHFYLNK